MPDPQPPKFQKRNHHFVTESWQKLFRGPENHLAAMERGEIKPQVSPGKLMSDEWIYTTYDEWFRPSDALEDIMSQLEGAAVDLIRRLSDGSCVPNSDDWHLLCDFLALTVCRNSDVMARGWRLAKQWGWDVLDQACFTTEKSWEFFQLVYGVTPTAEDVASLAATDLDALLNQAGALEAMQPQDPQLPEQLAVLGTLPLARMIWKQGLFLLDAPSGMSFVLSDRPVPLKDLARGFSTPLSRSVAFVADPSYPGERTRMPAPADIVHRINAEQARRAKDVVIGPDRATLEAIKGAGFTFQVRHRGWRRMPRSGCGSRGTFEVLS